MTDLKIDALAQLFGCYLHQDWQDEFDGDRSALQAIVESEPNDTVMEGVREIDALLEASLAEGDLRKLMIERVGCYFEPGSIGMSFGQWLVRAREVLVAA